MFDADKAFEIPNDGLKLEDGTHVISGASSPISLNPTISTIYLQTNGDIWANQGSASWRKVGSLNFVFHKIDQSVTIPDNQQMIVHGGDFVVTENGSLCIEQNAKFQVRED